MSLSKILQSEYDYEMANTRKTLERVPADKLAWQPHPKSMSLGRLAGHLAELGGWAATTVEQTELDFAPAGQPPYRPRVFTSTAELLAAFDESRAAGSAAIARSSDDDWRVPWALLAGGHQIFRMPRAAVLRSFVLNHVIHHRGQLTVYLRLLDIPVPGMYGPSADERP
jgi:uncharacterized damage-inducible protein DinB